MMKYDVIVFGATSFVGQILARYLVSMMTKNGTEKPELNWAIAGRSEAKLSALKQSLGEVAQGLELILVDASDETKLKAMCEQTKVVISTVGPYALYGEPLIKACVATGTDYCDLTGEPQWIAKMLSRYEDVAKITGARILHSCGFDSIPSDLGVYFLQQHAKQTFNQYCDTVSMRVKAAKGTASGGTVASMMNLVKEATTDAALRKLLANPYVLCPTGHPFHVRQTNLKMAQYDADFNGWIAPFVMAAINTRIVHRSNALLGNAYGEDFKYDEAMLMGTGVKGSMLASGLSLGLGGFMLAAALPPTRWVMESFILPKPGEGPDQEAQESGYYDLRFMGKTGSSQVTNIKVTGDRDPGYGSTAKMLAQAAFCLAQDIPKDKLSGGFWTPASAMAEHLIPRLEKDAGLTFSILAN